jgi:hypothetical protein
MSSSDRWSAPKTKALMVKDGGVVWAPDAETKVESVNAGSNAILRAVYFGTDVGLVSFGWSSGSVIGPAVPMTVVVDGATQIFVSYRELVDPPFGRIVCKPYCACRTCGKRLPPPATEEIACRCPQTCPECADKLREALEAMTPADPPAPYQPFRAERAVYACPDCGSLIGLEPGHPPREIVEQPVGEFVFGAEHECPLKKDR